MNEHAIKIIDALGGTAETARLFEIRMPSVSAWRSEGIPKPRMQYLAVARPDALIDVDVAAATAAVAHSELRKRKDAPPVKEGADA